MRFISAEEFLKQPEEVQKVFIDWWNPSIGDIYAYKEKDFKDYAEAECITSKNVIRLVVKNKYDKVPLLTEGQVRQFIEDITKDKYDILYYLKVRENVGFYKYTENETQPTYEIETHDLLQAYWKVATEIAAKEINLEMDRHS
jgi:hypothetical protein